MSIRLDYSPCASVCVWKPTGWIMAGEQSLLTVHMLCGCPPSSLRGRELLCGNTVLVCLYPAQTYEYVRKFKCHISSPARLQERCGAGVSLLCMQMILCCDRPLGLCVATAMWRQHDRLWFNTSVLSNDNQPVSYTANRKKGGKKSPKGDFVILACEERATAWMKMWCDGWQQGEGVNKPWLDTCEQKRIHFQRSMPLTNTYDPLI